VAKPIRANFLKRSSALLRMGTELFPLLGGPKISAL
jgi:hypothetical protein